MASGDSLLLLRKAEFLRVPRADEAYCPAIRHETTRRPSPGPENRTMGSVAVIRSAAWVPASLLLFLVPIGVPAAEGEPLPRARALTDRVYERTPGRLERGRYLSEHLLQCFVCHSERDWGAPGAPPLESRKGAGVVFSERPGRRLVAPNITPDPQTGAGRWTDDMLARAIREGIGHDGRALHWQMWYGSFAALSDEDLASVIVYLRALPPVRNALPTTLLPAEELAENARKPWPITAPVPDPASGDELARGRYLLTVADCSGCHTGWEAPRNPGLFAGGNLLARDGREVISTNITADPSGAGYSADGFIAVIRSGKGGTLHGVMPWVAFRGLDDADLRAMHAALGTLQPVRHFIGNAGEPQHCAVCGQAHALGAQNALLVPPRVPVDPRQLAALAGRYRNARFDWTVVIRADGERLFGSDQGGAEIELYPQSAQRFLAPGWTAPVEFVTDGRGRITHLASLELEPILLERVE
jgi:mono/diheme cytochrome c family protein